MQSIHSQLTALVSVVGIDREDAAHLSVISLPDFSCVSFFRSDANHVMNGTAFHCRENGSGPETWRYNTQEGEWSLRTGRKTSS